MQIYSTMTCLYRPSLCEFQSIMIISYTWCICMCVRLHAFFILISPNMSGMLGSWMTLTKYFLWTQSTFSSKVPFQAIAINNICNYLLLCIGFWFELFIHLLCSWIKNVNISINAQYFQMNAWLSTHLMLHLNFTLKCDEFQHNVNIPLQIPDGWCMC